MQSHSPHCVGQFNRVVSRLWAKYDAATSPQWRSVTAGPRASCAFLLPWLFAAAPDHALRLGRMSPLSLVCQIAHHCGMDHRLRGSIPKYCFGQAHLAFFIIVYIPYPNLKHTIFPSVSQLLNSWHLGLHLL